MKSLLRRRIWAQLMTELCSRSETPQSHISPVAFSPSSANGSFKLSIPSFPFPQHHWRGSTIWHKHLGHSSKAGGPGSPARPPAGPCSAAWGDSGGQQVPGQLLPASLRSCPCPQAQVRDALSGSDALSPRLLDKVQCSFVPKIFSLSGMCHPGGY